MDFVARWLSQSAARPDRYPISARIRRELVDRDRRGGLKDWLVLSWGDEQARFLFESMDAFHDEIVEFFEREHGVRLDGTDAEAVLDGQPGGHAEKGPRAADARAGGARRRRVFRGAPQDVERRHAAARPRAAQGARTRLRRPRGAALRPRPTSSSTWFRWSANSSWRRTSGSDSRRVSRVTDAGSARLREREPSSAARCNPAAVAIFHELSCRSR